MVKRPSDQAKLLLLGLLRTVSALATEHKAAGYAQHFHDYAQPITLRLARRTDIPSIQRCNLATLPVNYNQQFYANHLRQWPELALVAEAGAEENQRPLVSMGPFPTTQGEPKIVAYVLGKVDERVVPVESRWRSPYDDHHSYDSQYTTEQIGHVTSLAVLQDYRGRGIAGDLMRQLHMHMAHCYDVDAVGLHVRKSNTPAGRLYEKFGYSVEEQISSYYQDGEDAFFMRKELEHAIAPSKSLFGLRRSRPWETRQDLMLPRHIGALGGHEMMTGTL